MNKFQKSTHLEKLDLYHKEYQQYQEAKATYTKRQQQTDTHECIDMKEKQYLYSAQEVRK